MNDEIDAYLSDATRKNVHIASKLLFVAGSLAEGGNNKLASLLREAADKWMSGTWTPPPGFRLVEVKSHAHAQAATDAGKKAARIGAQHYLSGPMTGHPKLNYPAFDAAAAALRDAGIAVVNPAEIAAASDDWANCMREDLKALCDCEAIILIPGWETSAGAHLELHIAHRIGLRIVHLHELLQPDPQPYDHGERAYVAHVAQNAGLPLGGDA